MPLLELLPDIFTPTFELNVGGRPLEPEIAKSILEVSVTEHLNPPGEFNFRLQIAQPFPDSSEYEAIGGTDLLQFRHAFHSQDQAKQHTAGAEQYRAAAGGAASNRHIVASAGVDVHIISKHTAGPKNHGPSRQMPNSESFIPMIVFGFQEQCFIEG